MDQLDLVNYKQHFYKIFFKKEGIQNFQDENSFMELLLEMQIHADS